MNAKEPQQLPMTQDGKNGSIQKNGRNPPLNVVRQPDPPFFNSRNGERR
jgi:hypothetical protein